MRRPDRSGEAAAGVLVQVNYRLTLHLLDAHPMQRLRLTRGLLCCALCLAGANAATADDYHAWMDKLKALDQRCERARAQKLAPIREAMIRECQKAPSRNTLLECQQNAMTYGESTTGPNRNFIRGLYYDLSECQEAAEAWKQWRESRPALH